MTTEIVASQSKLEYVMNLAENQALEIDMAEEVLEMHVGDFDRSAMLELN